MSQDVDEKTKFEERINIANQVRCFAYYVISLLLIFYYFQFIKGQMVWHGLAFSTLHSHYILFNKVLFIH